MQSAAIPYRTDATGKLEILLVTSRKRRRWILPKGKVALGMLPHRSAAREAMQEAGVIGIIEDAPIAVIALPAKRGEPPSPPERVRVFMLEVTSVLVRWPEDHQRERRWTSVEGALNLVSDPAIRGVLKRCEGRSLGRALPGQNAG